MLKKRLPLLLLILVVVITSIQSQGMYTGTQRLQRGIDLYGQGRWGEAIVELRRLQIESADNTLRAEAAFWIAMSELNAGANLDAIHDFDEIGRTHSGSIRVFEVPYHKGRALYNLGRFTEALTQFQNYSNSIHIDGRYQNDARVGSPYSEGLYNDPTGDYDRKGASIYWIGECYYELGDFDRAEQFFTNVIRLYPKCHKYETSVNRLAMLEQKRKELVLRGALASGGSIPLENAGNGPYNMYGESVYSSTSTTPANSGNQASTDANGNPSAAAGRTTTTTATETQSLKNSTVDPAITEYQTRITPYLQQTVVPNNNDQMFRLLAVKAVALEIMDQLITAMNAYEVYDYGIPSQNYYGYGMQQQQQMGGGLR